MPNTLMKPQVLTPLAPTEQAPSLLFRSVPILAPDTGYRLHIFSHSYSKDSTGLNPILVDSSTNSPTWLVLV